MSLPTFTRALYFRLFRSYFLRTSLSSHFVRPLCPVRSHIAVPRAAAVSLSFDEASSASGRGRSIEKRIRFGSLHLPCRHWPGCLVRSKGADTQRHRALILKLWVKVDGVEMFGGVNAPSIFNSGHAVTTLRGPASGVNWHCKRVRASERAIVD